MARTGLNRRQMKRMEKHKLTTPEHAFIEPGIRPVVDALNAAGLTTIASCEGHWWRGRAPYVVFRAPVAQAAAIEQALRSESHVAPPVLRWHWSVTGMFNGTCDLVFRLSAPSLETSVFAPLPGLSRRVLDRDLRRVALVIGKVAQHREAGGDAIALFSGKGSRSLPPSQATGHHGKKPMFCFDLNLPRGFARLLRPLIAFTAIAAVSACADMTAQQTGGVEAVKLTKAQECAVGYDLARDIYQQARVDGTVIHVPKASAMGDCGQYAVTYLRRAGFAIVEDGTGQQAFAVDTYVLPNADGFVATARLPGLIVTRAYRPGEGGVYALSPASITKPAQG